MYFCICMYESMCIYVFMKVYACICVYMYLYVCTHVYMYVFQQSSVYEEGYSNGINLYIQSSSCFHQ